MQTKNILLFNPVGKNVNTSVCVFETGELETNSTVSKMEKVRKKHTENKERKLKKILESAIRLVYSN